MRIAPRRTPSTFDDAIFGTLAASMERLIAAGVSMDEASGMAAAALRQTADTVTPGLVVKLRKRSPRMLRARARRFRDFNRVLRLYWGQPLDRYLEICVAAEEVGERFHGRLRAAADEQNYQFEALTGLYARACRTAFEIHHALLGGFPMGALARCRTLHEVAVIMMVLSEFSEEIPDLAERFLLHDVVQNWKDAKIYQKHCEVLGTEPFTEAKMVAMEQDRHELLIRFGDDYRHSYGWASGVDRLSNPTFADLERIAGVAHLRGHYSWANHEVHADSKGWRLNILERGDVRYQGTGAMHFGMAEPASWSLVSLGQCIATLVFATDEISPLEILGCKAVQHLIDEAMDAFDHAETWAEEADSHVLPLSRWRRKIWLLRRHLTKHS